MWATRGALGLCLLAVALPAAAVSKAELEKRIEQLERRLDSRGLVDLMEQVTALQREVAQLRGDVEVQAHAMESLQKRQRELYLDIDRRLHRLETGGEQGAAAASAGTPAPPSAAAGPAPVSPPPAAGRAAAPSVA
ncbi:MAG TPA: tol-pal system protein YbgF, partial [Gammaproteobacteria bacterium]|nr:tol-pal system protein YbgF [Gammaproteobacteria bacterium]